MVPGEVQDADVSAVAEEAAVAAASSPPISFTGRGPRAVPGAQGRGAHLFLVVDEGAERIRALHGRLYRGVLRPHHRTDGSFTPHVTVGASEDPSRCETLSREAGPRVVRGRLSRIDLLDVGGDRVRSIASFALRPHG